MKYRRWTEPEIAFLTNAISGRKVPEVVKMFNSHFGTNLRMKQVRGALSCREIRSGLGKGCPGVKRPSKSKDGDESIKSGYVAVKVSGEWVIKHIYTWESAHGKVPKGHVIMFADQDRSNFNLDNLICVSRKELGTMAYLGVITKDKNLTKTGLLIADIMIKQNELKRG